MARWQQRAFRFSGHRVSHARCHSAPAQSAITTAIQTINFLILISRLSFWILNSDFWILPFQPTLKR
jgi:hypothetical protein